MANATVPNIFGLVLCGMCFGLSVYDGDVSESFGWLLAFMWQAIAIARRKDKP